MKNATVSLVWATALVALVGFSATPVWGQDLCPYDTSGDYTYDADRTPTYLFFGDGQITYDGSIPWYMDDTLACYNVYQTPGYLQYFPKCDFDGNGAVSIDEVYDVYYRVHPVNQTDPDVQKICSQMFRTGPFYYCHPSRYDRVSTDKDAIVADYPAAGAIFDGVSGSLGQQTLQWEYNQLRCSTPGAFNPAAFDALNACYLGTTTCEGQPCQVATINFSQHVDPYLTELEYSDVAQNFGGICERVATPHQAPQEVPGIYSYKYASDNNYWIYNVRATAQCVGAACACEHRYELYTHKDYPGNVYFMNETNNSTTACTDPRFPGGTTCDDADGDGVCDADDQCPGEDDNLDTDGDGTPNCLEECDTDPNKTAPGICGCGIAETDSDGDGWLDCQESCDYDPNKTDPGVCGCGIGDTDGDDLEDCVDNCPTDPHPDCGVDPCYPFVDTDMDGICDNLDGCPTDPNKTDPGVCGCGIAETDSDGDGWLDCQESCDYDPNKTDPGVCGCGIGDTDGDGLEDCVDNCPTDPNPDCGVDPCYPYVDTDMDGICDNVDGCPTDPNKADPGQCGCGTPDTDSDGDGVANCNDICPGFDDNLDSNGNGIPDGCETPTSTLIEDFENTTDTWPWAPWQTPGPYGWSAIDPAAAHDGAQGLDIHEWHYRNDVSFGAVEGEMISMWCYNGTAQGCRLGFGADATGRYEVRLMAFQKKLVLGDSHGVTDFNGDPVPWTTGGINDLTTTHLSADIGNAWYKMEVHVGAGGAIDAQLWAEDGTPIGSVQHTFGAFPATGVAIYGGNDEYVDTIELGPSTGVCIDMDQDGVCDADDMCRGNDTTGDADGDDVCNDLDICWGIDLLGDADGDGVCDETPCPGNVPAYYDVTTSAIDWIASGTCAEAHYGVGGIPVCQQAEWQDHVDAIADIIAAYPFTQVAADTQIWRREPYMIMCSGFTGSPDNAPMFDDLNGCYRGNSEWNSNYSIVFINFDWGVNAHELADRYGQRAAQFGGACETNYNNSPDAYLSGFHVDPAQSSGTWRMWDVKAHSQHDANAEDFACRAHLRVYTDSTQPGQVFEDSLVNYSTGVCTDSRFLF